MLDSDLDMKKSMLPNTDLKM